MRVYFVGSHATGKTTLCRFVSKRYGLPMITEVARAVLAESEAQLDDLRTNLDGVDEYQRQVFRRQVEVEARFEDDFVSDRAFDNLAYAAEYATVVGELVRTPDFIDYTRRVASGIVFFLRPHPSLVTEDGVRAGVEWDSVVRIDGMVKLLLELYDIPYIPVATPILQERVRAVDAVLAACGALSSGQNLATC